MKIYVVILLNTVISGTSKCRRRNNMPRINLGEPYEVYIQNQIKSGLFSSATEVIKDALRNRMEREQRFRIEKAHTLLAKGEADIQLGKTVPYTHSLMNEISEIGRNNSIDKKPVKDEIKF